MNPSKTDETRQNRTISARQERVAVALASGRSVAATARDCRVHAGTIWEWMKQEGFKERVRELRQALTDSAIGRLSDLMAGAAADTLLKLFSAESDNVKLESVKAAFELYLHVQSAAELKSRIEALEASQPRGRR
jgi:hypothetical protein